MTDMGIFRRAFQGRSIRARLRNGVQLSVDGRDYNGRQVAIFGEVEPQITRICAERMTRETVFLDIGANHGAIGFMLSRLPNAGRIYMFEPQPHLCGLIQACIDLNQLENVSLERYGLLDRDAVLQMAVDPAHSGVGTFARSGRSIVELPVREASAAVSRIVGAQPFAAKVDVEGAEVPVLRRLTSFANLQWVVFECDEASHKPAVWNLVREAGLRLYGIPLALWGARTIPIDGLEGMTGFSDFIAERPGHRMPDRLRRPRAA